MPSIATNVPWLIPKEARFRPDGTVRVDPEYGQYETGTYHGVKYRIWFKSGSAEFAGASDSTLDIGPYKREKPGEREKKKQPSPKDVAEAQRRVEEARRKSDESFRRLSAL